MKLRMAVEIEFDIPVKREVSEREIGIAAEGFYYDLGDLIENYIKESNLPVGFELINYEHNTDEVPILSDNFVDNWGL